METESSEVSQVNALCSSPSKHFAGRTKANECRERYGKVTVFPQLEQHSLATILWSYTVLLCTKSPKQGDAPHTQNVPLFSKHGKMMLKCQFLPCHWHLLITKEYKRSPWHAANLSESAPHRLRPGPGPNCGGPGLANTSNIL